MRLLLPRARVLACLLSLLPAAGADTLFVDAGLTTGANDGSTWDDAFRGTNGLQTALAAALAGDEIFVAEGLYLPTTTGARTVSFALRDGVALYGGFLGGETGPDERPPIGTAPSVLSGDLAGNDASGAGGVASDNSLHVVTTAGTTASAVLDGFTVTGGNANVSGANQDRGGGILCVGGASPTIRSCRFVANRCTFGGAAGYVNTGAAPSFTDCSFEDGFGGSFGGAFDIAGGGAVLYERCLFRGNTAARAGALEIFSTNGVRVNNCIFADNTATGSGGGGAIWVGSGGNTQVRNCTVVANTATANSVGGLRNQGAGNTTVVNCIFWDNVGLGGAQGAANQLTGTTNVTYSNVEGTFPGVGNVDGDPQFADLAAGDFALNFGAPGVDAGNNAEVIAGTTVDFAGSARFVDEPFVADTGVGSVPIVDMGAFELSPAFALIAGCFGNTASLVNTTPTLTLGQPLGLELTASVHPTGTTLYYAGFDAADGAGCGVDIPGFGELLLGLTPAPILLGSSPTVAGTSSFVFDLPAVAPALLGQTFGFQAVNAAATLELSGSVVATVAP